MAPTRRTSTRRTSSSAIMGRFIPPNLGGPIVRVDLRGDRGPATFDDLGPFSGHAGQSHRYDRAALLLLVAGGAAGLSAGRRKGFGMRASPFAARAFPPGYV